MVETKKEKSNMNTEGKKYSLHVFQDFVEFGKQLSTTNNPNTSMVKWNWGLSIYDMIPQIHMNNLCVRNKFLNLEVTSDGDIIFNSRIWRNGGVGATLRSLDPEVFAWILIDKKNIAIPTIFIFIFILWCL